MTLVCGMIFQIDLILIEIFEIQGYNTHLNIRHLVKMLSPLISHLKIYM